MFETYFSKCEFIPIFTVHDLHNHLNQHSCLIVNLLHTHHNCVVPVCQSEEEYLELLQNLENNILLSEQ